MTIDEVSAVLTDALGTDKVRRKQRVDRYTTWKVGGPAALLCEVYDAAALGRAAALARATGLPWLVLGRGSNVLLDDAGFDGIIIVNRSSHIQITDTTVHAESGALLSVLARRTAESGLIGLEWCHDIPGSVGGAIINNAGANGGTIADTLVTAQVLTVEDGMRAMDAAALAFGYRQSRLRSEDVVAVSPRPVVLTATFRLQHGEIDETKQRMSAQRARRKATQPGGSSAGSVFKNPPGDSAGRLIESVGLKGQQCGGAAISTLHANFIVTGPRATANDILSLIALARHTVRERCGISLQPEVQYVRHDGRIGPPGMEDL